MPTDQKLGKNRLLRKWVVPDWILAVVYTVTKRNPPFNRAKPILEKKKQSDTSFLYGFRLWRKIKLSEMSLIFFCGCAGRSFDGRVVFEWQKIIPRLTDQNRWKTRRFATKKWTVHWSAQGKTWRQQKFENKTKKNLRSIDRSLLRKVKTNKSCGGSRNSILIHWFDCFCL